MATENFPNLKQAFDITVTNTSDSFISGFIETLKRNLKIVWCYKFKIVNSFINTLIVYSLYFFIATLVPDSLVTTNFYEVSSVSFFFSGALIVEISSKIVVRGLSSFQSEMRQGTFETLITLNFGLKRYVYAEIIAESIYTLFISIIFFIPIIFIFPFFNGVTVTFYSILSLLLVVLSMFMFTIVFSLVGANFTILVKRGREIAMVLIGVLLLLSGTLFPIEILPKAVQIIAYCSPLTHAVSAFRLCLFGQGTLMHPTVWVAVITIFASTLLMFVIFQVTFRRIFKKVQQKGTLGEY